MVISSPSSVKEVKTLPSLLQNPFLYPSIADDKVYYLVTTTTSLACFFFNLYGTIYSLFFIRTFFYKNVQAEINQILRTY